MSEKSERTTSNGSTSSQADSRARISVTPENAPESKANEAGSGPSLLGSFASYDRDSCSWKTSQLCLDGEWEEFSETWPKAGTMRSGIAYRRQPLVPRIFATAFFALRAPLTWNTPCARDYKGYTMRSGESICNQLREIFPSSSGAPHPEFAEEVQGFPIGWTDCEDSGTPSSRKSPSGLDGE